MPSQISVGGEQHKKDNPPKIIDNPAAGSSEALKNSQAPVDKAKQ
jgi:hypothetical protein